MAEYEQELIALGRTIRQVREERGMSTAALAAAAGIEQQYLETLEGGGLDPRYDVLLALGDGLGVGWAALVSGAGDQDAHTDFAFGQRLRELRAEHNVSQEVLSRRTGIHRTTIGTLEQGDSDPRLSTVLRFARGLDVPPRELVEGREQQDAMSNRNAAVVFGERLCKMRTERGLSKENFAQQADMHPTAVRRLERGDRDPQLTTILRLARGLDVQPGALVDELITEGDV